MGSGGTGQWRDGAWGGPSPGRLPDGSPAAAEPPASPQECGEEFPVSGFVFLLLLLLKLLFNSAKRSVLFAFFKLELFFKFTLLLFFLYILLAMSFLSKIQRSGTV